MRVKVTKPITSNGVYYALDEVVEMEPGKAGSYIRLYGWVAEPDKAVKTPTPSKEGVGASAPKKRRKAVSHNDDRTTST